MFVCLLFYWPFVFLPLFILRLHNLIYQWFIRALISGGKWWWYQQLIYQAPVSLGFSRQEHWSGLPFPSPMHESEKWKWSRSVVSDSQPPHGLQPTRLLRPWNFPGKSPGVGCHCLLRKLCLLILIIKKTT